MDSIDPANGIKHMQRKRRRAQFIGNSQKTSFGDSTNIENHVLGPNEKVDDTRQVILKQIDALKKFYR